MTIETLAGALAFGAVGGALVVLVVWPLFQAVRHRVRGTAQSPSWPSPQLDRQAGIRFLAIAGLLAVTSLLLPDLGFGRSSDTQESPPPAANAPTASSSLSPGATTTPVPSRAPTVTPPQEPPAATEPPPTTTPRTPPPTPRPTPAPRTPAPPPPTAPPRTPPPTPPPTVTPQPPTPVPPTPTPPPPTATPTPESPRRSPPVAVARCVAVRHHVRCDGSDSRNAVRFRWKFENGPSRDGVRVEHRYGKKRSGRFEVRLTVANRAGDTNSETVTVSIPE